jgi:hypothetical protein
MLRKTSAAAAVIAFATVGSALFGGAALATDAYTGGDGGRGGDVWQECHQDAKAFNIFDVSGRLKADDDNNVTQTGTATATNTCTATGGAGGAGGAGQNNY